MGSAPEQGVGGWGLAELPPPRGFHSCLYRDCSYFPCLRGFGGGMQLLIAVKGSRNWERGGGSHYSDGELEAQPGEEQSPLHGTKDLSAGV